MSAGELTERQRAALSRGKTVQWVSEAFGVPRPRLVALIAATGLSIDPATDQVRARPACAAADQPITGEPVPAHQHTAPASTTAAADGLESFLAAARQVDEKKIARAVAKVDAAVAALRDLYEPWLAAQKQAQERTLRLEEAAAKEAELLAQLEQVRAEAKLWGGTATRRKTTAPTGLRAAEVRAWAKQHGIACPNHGVIPRTVAQQYQAAHPGQSDEHT